MSILEFLGFKKKVPEAPERADTQTVRKIVDELDHLPPERARFIAAFAYILSRVAHADLEISAEESMAMEALVIEQGGLPQAQAVIVVQMAKTQALLFGGTENYLVTREFNRIATRDEKLQLVRCLFAVSAADESISTTESRTIRQIADELMLDHADYIAVRTEFSRHIEVMKAPDNGDDAG